MHLLTGDHQIQYDLFFVETAVLPVVGSAAGTTCSVVVCADATVAL
jgi:hypothetical protein